VIVIAAAATAKPGSPGLLEDLLIIAAAAGVVVLAVCGWKAIAVRARRLTTRKKDAVRKEQDV
jgi:hypothetical protein